MRANVRPISRCSSTPIEAFTRVELCAVLGAVLLLVCVVLPALAQGKPRTQLLLCFNNLRQIGQGILLFDEEHGQTDPWRLPASKEFPRNGLENNSWWQFSLMSNELQTAKILSC